MSEAYEQLLAVLDLDPRGPDTFTGPPCTTPFGFVFGGHVIAQAVVAASRTVLPDRQAHSLHLYFIRAGEVDRPISYVVDRVRDGGAFSTRRVAVQQGELTIAEVLVSFHLDLPGYEHQSPAPAAHADPASLPAVRDLWSYAGRMREWAGFDVRWGGPWPFAASTDPLLTYARLDGPAPADPVLARALLGYVSDVVFLCSILLPLGIALWDSEHVRGSSLDHSLWFHTTPDLSGWLTYEHVSPVARGARGLALGGLFTAAGERMASTAQEGFVRPAR